MFSTDTQIRVRYAETDQMGIVHHSNYAIFFEIGRTDFFAEHFVHYHQLEQQGLFAPLLELELKLKHPARYGDILVLETRPELLKGLSLSMVYQIVNQDQTTIATGRTLHALCGPNLKPVHPRQFGALYQTMKSIFAPNPAN